MRTTMLMAGFLLALLAGCSSTPPLRQEPVEVSGVVLTSGGQPVRDVTVNFFPTTAEQVQGGAQLKGDGKFSVKLIPGKYTYAFEGTGAKSLPEKYRSNDSAHSFEIPASGTSDLTIKLEK